MVIETLGVVKALSALKGAAIGLAHATPIMVANSAQATQQIVTAATPLVVQGATGAAGMVQQSAQASQQLVTAATPVVAQAGALTLTGLAALGHLALQGVAGMKAGIASLGILGTKTGIGAKTAVACKAVPTAGALAAKAATASGMNGVVAQMPTLAAPATTLIAAA